MVKRNDILKAAEHLNVFSRALGGYVNIDGEWHLSNNPDKFSKYLQKLGFDVVKCYETSFSSAIAETADGYRIAYNGHCVKFR